MARGTSPKPMLRPEGFAVKPTRESSPRPRLRPSDPETTAVMSPETYEAVSDQTEAAFGPAPVSSIEEVEEIRNTPPGFEQKASLSEIVGDAIDPSSDEKVKKLEDYLAGVGPVQRDPFDEVLSRGWIKAIKNSPYGDKYKSNLNLLSQDGIDTVKGMFKSSLGADPKWDPRKENWCATFVNTVLMGLDADLLQTGDKYDRLRARKYVKYGSPVSRDNLQQGDIVVLDFPRNADGDIDFRDPTAKRDGVGDHVTFYAGDNSSANKPGTGFIGVLGGNQGFDSEIGLTEYSEANILATRRITYDDIDYEFTKELAKENPDFNSFLKKEGEGFDMEAFSNPDPLGFDKGGLAESKGLSWGELIVDNILGLDNEYESFGEKLGKAINEDEIKFLKDAAVGVYEGTKEFVQAPVETTKQVVNEIKDSVTRLGSEDLNTRLQRMYGVSYEQATDEQVNQAREAVLGDALTALELVPAAKVTTTVAGAAIPSGLKADAIGQTKALLSGDREFLSGTPTPKADAQPAGAQVPGMFTPREKPKETSTPSVGLKSKEFDTLQVMFLDEALPEIENKDADFFTGLISGPTNYDIQDSLKQLAIANHFNYGPEYYIFTDAPTQKSYWLVDAYEEIGKEVGRVFNENLHKLNSEQVLRLAALQRLNLIDNAEGNSAVAAEIAELAEGINATLNLVNKIRIDGPEQYLGSQPFNTMVKVLDENGAIVDRKISELKGKDGKYKLTDLLGLGSTTALNELFEKVILDITESNKFIDTNSTISVSGQPKVFNSYIKNVLKDYSDPNLTYQGVDKTFRNLNVEVIEEFLNRTANKPVPLTGSRVLSILQNDPRVNSKNIPKEIFEAEKDEVLTPEQVKDILEFYTYQVKPKSQSIYGGFQRQTNEGLAIGIPQDYNELTLNIDDSASNTRTIQPNRRHFDNETLAHTRYTVMSPDTPNLSDETKELLGDDEFIVVEELQSDLLSGGYKKYQELDFESLVNNKLARPSGPSGTTYMDKLKSRHGVLVSRYFDNFKEFAIRKFDRKYNKGFDADGPDARAEESDFIGSIADKHEKWLKNAYPTATLNQINVAMENFRSDARNLLSDMVDTDGTLHRAVLRSGTKTRNQAEVNIEAIADPWLYGTPPIKKNIEGVESNLQNLISKASQLGINKIVIPPFEKIASARFFGEELDLALKNQVMDKDGNIKTGHRLYQTYVTDLEKALKKFEQSYPIKVHRDVDIPYQGQNSLSALPDIKYSDGLDITMLKGIVIDISDMDKDFDLENPRFAEGGAVGNMNQQMSFAFEDGGLRDDGMMRDPVSGNEVPPGSTAKEVRDDIPAQLSEGEYVVPADVVRYYGVKFFEDLRDNAKMGLQDMEARGRIGGEPVPAGGPTADDLTPEEMAAIQEMMGMNQGGFVDMYQQQQNLYSAPNPAMNNQMGMASGGQVRGYNQAGSVSQPQQAEQGFYQAGQQAQQAAFTGFPLGATIFPSVETAVEPVPEPETTSVTLYGPNYLTDSSQVVILTLPADQTRYEQLIAQGYTTEMPVATASDNGGGTPPPPGESKPAYEDWLNSADFNSEAGIEKFIAGIEYDPSKSKLDMQTLGATMLAGPIAGLATAAGGALRGGGLQAISDLRAASLIAKAQGLDELAGKIDAQVADIIKDGPGILDFLDDIFATGKQKANAWAKTQGHSDIETATEAGVTPKPPTTSPTPPAQTAAKKAVSEYESLKKPSGGDDDDPFPTVVTDKSIAETKAIMDKQTSDTVEDTTKNLERTTAKVADIQSGKNTSGQVGFGKGGLMAKGKKKKK